MSISVCSLERIKDNIFKPLLKSKRDMDKSHRVNDFIKKSNTGRDLSFNSKQKKN